ncbi:hypothetical protein C5E45_20305 [Nocardia nova]|uniref:Apea-like HEPN domain-containing protein n=1 Tax=Nocardia nova TaxID=37330 RepID=A0A2S6AMD7_9NOCA|nr:hypothetical protein C5E45_20305 [Nocardia nova]
MGRHPDLAGVPDTAWDRDARWAIAYAAVNADHAIMLHRVGLQLREKDEVAVPTRFPPHRDVPFGRITDHAMDNIQHWFALLEDWASVVTGEDINHRQPRYDTAVSGPGLRVWRNGEWRTGNLHITTPAPKALSADLLRAILDRVAEGTPPPVEHQLWRDSYAAYLRADFRKSILDAATCVEVCLIHRIEAAEQRTGSRCKDTGMQRRSGWLQKHDPDYTEPTELKRLARCRNKVVHAGAVVPYDDARVAVDIAFALATKYGRPRDPRADLN